VAWGRGVGGSGQAFGWVSGYSRNGKAHWWGKLRFSSRSDALHRQISTQLLRPVWRLYYNPGEGVIYSISSWRSGSFALLWGHSSAALSRLFWFFFCEVKSRMCVIGSDSCRYLATLTGDPSSARLTACKWRRLGAIARNTSPHMLGRREVHSNLRILLVVSCRIQVCDVSIHPHTVHRT
jgi:hypothetical protein